MALAEVSPVMLTETSPPWAVVTLGGRRVEHDTDPQALTIPAARHPTGYEADRSQWSPWHEAAAADSWRRPRLCTLTASMNGLRYLGSEPM